MTDQLRPPWPPIPDPRDLIGHTPRCPRRPVVETIRAGVATYVCQTCHAAAPIDPLDQ